MVYIWYTYAYRGCHIQGIFTVFGTYLYQFTTFEVFSLVAEIRFSVSDGDSRLIWTEVQNFEVLVQNT